MADNLAYQIVDDVRKKYIEVNGLTRFQQIVNSFRATENGEVVKRTRAILAKALKQARAEGIAQIGGKIHNNQRHAEEGLKVRQYSKKSGVIGGYISILKSRRNGASSPRPIPPTKSGEERQWSERTKQLYGYQGADAQFILYWLTAGTSDRKAGFGRRDKRTKRYGNVSTRSARDNYFNGSHDVGRINPNTLNPGLYDILERVVNNEVIPEIDKLYEELGNK